MEKSIFITGAGSGIGLDMVQELSGKGYQIFGTYISNDEKVALEKVSNVEAIKIKSPAISMSEPFKAAKPNPPAALISPCPSHIKQQGQFGGNDRSFAHKPYEQNHRKQNTSVGIPRAKEPDSLLCPYSAAPSVRLPVA